MIIITRVSFLIIIVLSLLSNNYNYVVQAKFNNTSNRIDNGDDEAHEVDNDITNYIKNDINHKLLIKRKLIFEWFKIIKKPFIISFAKYIHVDCATLALNICAQKYRVGTWKHSVCTSIEYKKCRNRLTP